MHTHHDLDLVIALADGSLADPTAAEELVATCPECAQAHEAYLTVRTAVAATPAPTMTELEKRRLHNSIWTAIEEDRSDVTSVPGVPTPRTRSHAPTPRTRSHAPTPRTRSWWYRVAPAAAALAVVVGVGAILTGGGDRAAFDTLAADMGGAESREALEPQGDSGEEESADMAALPNTTTAGEETAETVAASPPLTALVITTAELEGAVAAFETEVEEGYRLVDRDEECVGTELDGEPVVATKTAILDDAPALFVALGEPDEVSAVVVIHQRDCTLLYDPR